MEGLAKSEKMAPPLWPRLLMNSQFRIVGLEPMQWIAAPERPIEFSIRIFSITVSGPSPEEHVKIVPISSSPSMIVAGAPLELTWDHDDLARTDAGHDLVAVGFDGPKLLNGAAPGLLLVRAD